MNKRYLTLAACAVAVAVGVGAVVGYAHGSPQQAPTSKKQGRVNPSGPTAAGTAGTYRPTVPPKPTVRPSNPQTAAGG